MISWFKKKVKPFNSAEALKKSEAAFKIKEANELKEYKQSLFQQIEFRCKQGYTELYCGSHNTFNKNEKELTDMLNDYGYMVDKSEDILFGIPTSTYSILYNSLGSPVNPRPTPPPKVYQYVIKWGDKATIFKNEMKEIIAEADDLMKERVDEVSDEEEN